MSGVWTGAPLSAWDVLSGRLEGFEIALDRTAVLKLMRAVPALMWTMPAPPAKANAASTFSANQEVRNARLGSSDATTPVNQSARASNGGERSSRRLGMHRTVYATTQAQIVQAGSVQTVKAMPLSASLKHAEAGVPGQDGEVVVHNTATGVGYTASSLGAAMYDAGATEVRMLAAIPCSVRIRSQRIHECLRRAAEQTCKLAAAGAAAPVQASQAYMWHCLTEAAWPASPAK